jgi:hypothetical protein
MAQNKPPDPAAMLAQIEQAKVAQKQKSDEMDIQYKGVQLQAETKAKEDAALQDAQKQQDEVSLERERIASQERIAAGQQATQLLVAQKQADAMALAEANKLEAENFHKNEDRKLEAELARQKMNHERNLATTKAQEGVVKEGIKAVAKPAVNGAKPPEPPKPDPMHETLKKLGDGHAKMAESVGKLAEAFSKANAAKTIRKNSDGSYTTETVQ